MKTLLETKRLILRPLAQDDFPEAHAWASHPENTRLMKWGPNTEEQTRDFLNKAKPGIDFAIVAKPARAAIGSCRLHPDLARGTGEAGWILHRDFWKKGYGTELCGELIRYGFEDLKLRRIIAECASANYGSRRVMERNAMRREAAYVRAFWARADREWIDAAGYAILAEEWETCKEIAYYNALPVEFHGFIEVPELTDGVIRLVCTAKKPAIPAKRYVPAYEFAVCHGGEKAGEINLRIGYAGFGPDSSSLYYGGQIGYGINENYRGLGYAGRACRLLLPVARAHRMTKLLITNAADNGASRRVCEKLGLKHVRTALLPEWHDLYQEGQRFQNIFEWDVEC